MAIERISSPSAPPAAGHYSQAVIHRGVVYLSAQLPKAADGSLAAGVADQTRQVLGNLEHVLRAAGSGLAELLAVTVYLSRIADWGAMNDAFGAVLGDTKPARSVIVVAEMKPGVLVSMDAIAAVVPTEPDAG